MAVNSKKTKAQLTQLKKAGYLSDQELIELNCELKPKEVSKLIHDKILNFKSADASTKNQGDRLEEVVHYLLENCGFLINVKNGERNRVHELDHWARFDSPVRDLLKGMGIEFYQFLGESKNYSKSKSKIDVNIIYKVEGLKYLLDIGIACYFTRNGVTGDDLAAATALVKDCCNTTNTISICFTDKDWKFLYENPHLFNRLFWYKLDHYKRLQNVELPSHDHIENYGT